MEIKTINETSRSFEVLLDDEGKEKKVFVTQRKEAEWKMYRADGAGIKQSVWDFLVDAINSYMKTGRIPEGRVEVGYTTTEFRHWICPHCGKKNTTDKVEQGYPLPECHFCEEQHAWGNKGGE